MDGTAEDGIYLSIVVLHFVRGDHMSSSSITDVVRFPQCCLVTAKTKRELGGERRVEEGSKATRPI